MKTAILSLLGILFCVAGVFAWIVTADPHGRGVQFLPEYLCAAAGCLVLFVLVLIFWR